MTLGPGEGMGAGARPVGLKVHYTFDKECQDRCLARLPQLVTVHTFSLDETNTIGLVDLQLCLQAVTNCSPELLSNPDSDYVVYAYDYSEADVPLVGQGMLSWLREPGRREKSNNQCLNMVTGRITKNMMAMFSTNAIKETIEVKLKFVLSNKIQRPALGWQIPPAPAQQQLQQQMVPQSSLQQHPQLNVQTPQPQPANTNANASSQPVETVQTPSAEWNQFMQANPQLGHQTATGGVGSPLPVQSRSNTPVTVLPEQLPLVAPAPQSGSRPASRASKKAKQQDVKTEGKEEGKRSSRKPSGRPRGRPRKRPHQEGSTSGYEDGTDGDEGSMGQQTKKRVTSTMVDSSINTPFASAPESLRVAASTSGSLRTFRPLAMAGAERPAGSHLQDVPRAPTPIPDGNAKGRGRGGSTSRRLFTLGREPSLPANTLPSSQAGFCDPRLTLSPPNNDDDGRSPTAALTPAAFSDDSVAEIGSSPPVPRPFLRDHSSQPPSSPILPPMPPPTAQLDSGFMSGGLDDSAANVDDVKMQDGPVQAEFRAPPQRTKVPVHVFRLQEVKGGTHDLVPVSSPCIGTSMSSDYGPTLPPLQRPRTQPGAPPPAKDVQSERCSSLPAQHPEHCANDLAQCTEPSDSRPGSMDDNLMTQPQLPPPTQQSEEEVQRRQSLALPNLAPATTPTCDEADSGAAKSTHPLCPPPSGRQLNRSESSGPLALPTPASEPSPPMAFPQPRAKMPEATSRANAESDKPALPSLPAVPASDPVGPPASGPSLNPTSFSEAPCPPSDAGGQVPPTSPPAWKANKNYVKKQSIRERLERAVMNGEMPPYCTNCGAIETPTWRKINTREYTGTPDYVEYSEKPGRVTAIEILTRDSEHKPTAYRVIKKALGPDDDKRLWTEKLLCNPCGIWLSKNNKHRPQDRWAKDQDRLGQDRRKRGTGRAPHRKKKATSKDSQGAPAPTSEAYLFTDGLTGEDLGSADGAMKAVSVDHLSILLESAISRAVSESNTANNNAQTTASGRSGFSDAASTRTRGTGTANSPITLDLETDLGSTRRLLFPSPKQQKDRHTLGEVSPNIITPAPDSEMRDDKDAEGEATTATVSGASGDISKEDDLEHLFRSPLPPRPSTPPPNAASTATMNDRPFKTPSRPTPSHRPVTRSVSRSIRSIPLSPSISRTPSRTPRAAQLLFGESPTLRRSPRLNGSGTRSAERERAMRGLDHFPSDSDMMLDILGTAIQDHFSDQAEIDAILDKCLSVWSDVPASDDSDASLGKLLVDVHRDQA